MDKRLRQYIEKQDTRPLDPKILENYTKTMTEIVVPKIIENIKRREWRAMELRFPSPAKSDLKRKHD